MNNIQSNIWKFFIFSLTGRRSYITILSIYFLTLPNTTANMIGRYTGIGNLLGFIMEIPSGYFADRFGHRKTLILAKISMLISTSSFIFIQNFYGFISGSIFLCLSLALNSGTASAFMHETLQSMGKSDDYSKIMGRLKGYISLISMILIITLPFFTKINILIPLYITLGLDFLGLIISLSFIKPNIQKNIDKNKIKGIVEIFKDSKKLNFLPFIIFVGSITGFMVGESAYRYVYLESLGYPVILVGLVLGFSRFVRFLIGRYAYLIEENFTIKQHLLFELFFFSLAFLLIAYLQNPYIIAVIFMIIVGYKRGRYEVIESYVIKHYVYDKNYKATILSIKSQLESFFQFIVPISLGFIMNYSYKIGYYSLTAALFGILLVSFLLIKEK